MNLPKLSQLQSRFAASLGASLFLFLLYLSLNTPHFAYALETDLAPVLDRENVFAFGIDSDTNGGGAQQEIKRASDTEKRATSQGSSLLNNQPQNKDINAGETQYWTFTKEIINGPAGEQGRGFPGDTSTEIIEDETVRLELRKRQSTKQVYITLNTCTQPAATSSSTDIDDLVPPQLILYYSQSSANSNPGPSSTGDQQTVPVVGGYGIVNITTDNDVYIGLSAPNITTFKGSWNYEIAGSIDAPYHAVDDSTPNLHFVDSDFHAALLITDAMTQANSNSTVYQQWMNLTPPYGMAAGDHRDPSILGVSRSYCGLFHNARSLTNLQPVVNQNVASITNRGLGGQPKEQFYITSLNASSTYWGFLVMQGNSSASGLDVVGGGGTVWQAINFTTKTESNCALLYNLTFCDQVAYAVPTNPDLFSPRDGVPALAELYDNNALSYYQNFNYSLQQIPCNTTASAQYSLARDCTDCARAYKQWLCAVTIPRCADFSNNATYLKPRNVAQPFPNGTMLNPEYLGPDQSFLGLVATNQSRNLIIDQQIQPGPYKEVLPCDDLCYDLVQSCPAALQFGCPYRGRGLEDSYGFRSSNGGEITCSYLGAAYYLSGAGKIGVDLMMKILLTIATVLGLTMI